MFLAFTLCAFVVRRRRQPVRVEKWAWRVFLTGAVTAVGITLLLKRVRPILAPVLLAATIPLDLVIAQVTSMGNLLLPVMFAFGILGRHLAVSLRPSRPPGTQESPDATRFGRGELTTQG